MSKFIYDYTGNNAIRIAHISKVRIAPGNNSYNPETKESKRLWNVEALVRGEAHTLAENIESKELAS